MYHLRKILTEQQSGLLLMSKEQKQNPFSLIPYQVFLDDRISKTELRVLGAILSFGDGNTSQFYLSLEQISERCGLPHKKISRAITGLSSLGWIKKTGKGGNSSHCLYEFTLDTALYVIGFF